MVSVSPYKRWILNPYLVDPGTRSALHAPTSKEWQMAFDFPFGTSKQYVFFPKVFFFYRSL